MKTIDEILAQSERYGDETVVKEYKGIIATKGHFNIKEDAKLNACKAVLFDEMTEALDSALDFISAAKTTGMFNGLNTDEQKDILQKAKQLEAENNEL